MADKFTDSSATRIIAALDARAERKLKNGAQTLTTWGSVGAVDAGNKTASAYIYGETDGAYMSEGFRIPETMYLTVGQKVKVAIDHATGERWVEEVLYPTSTYKKLAIDVSSGYLLFGGGTATPDTRLRRSAAGALLMDSNGAASATPTYLYVEGATSGSAGVVLRQSGDTHDRIAIGAYAGGTVSIEFGDGANARDTNLFRSAANTLRTDDNLIVAMRLGVSTTATVYGQINLLSATAGDAGIGFGTDTVLYRAAANHLKIGSGGSGPGVLTIGDTDVGADLSATKLNIGIERPWVFEQYSSGASTALALTPLTAGGKAFHVTDSTSAPVFTVSAIDASPYVAVSTHYRVGSNQVVGTRKTGWGAPTGTATRTSFATDTVTLINLARAVKALVDDLTSHGLIGA